MLARPSLLVLILFAAWPDYALANDSRSCVRVTDDSNAIGTRVSIENRCTGPVQVVMCARSPGERPIRKTATFAPWDGRTQTGFDFPARSNVRYRLCPTSQPCPAPEC